MISWFLFREHRDSRSAVLTDNFNNTDLVAGISELPFKLVLNDIGDVIQHGDCSLKRLSVLIATLVVFDPQFSVHRTIHEYNHRGQIILCAGSSKECDAASCGTLSERITDAIGRRPSLLIESPTQHLAVCLRLDWDALRSVWNGTVTRLPKASLKLASVEAQALKV